MVDNDRLKRTVINRRRQLKQSTKPVISIGNQFLSEFPLKDMLETPKDSQPNDDSAPNQSDQGQQIATRIIPASEQERDGANNTNDEPQPLEI